MLLEFERYSGWANLFGPHARVRFIHKRGQSPVEFRGRVLTGAMTPARFSESDAAFNLGMAFATAQTAPPGVYITINGCVFRGDEVTKDKARGCFTR
jgi:L-asparaginase/Glu-tRNA(Gln) amidotransferase subunit D